MEPLRFVARGPAATRALGAALAHALRPGVAVLLVGDLGAGKTTFAQGLAAGLGVSGPVTSPSFALVHEHDGRPSGPRLAHMDFYRLTAPEVCDLGLDDYLECDDVVAAVEWPERAGASLADVDAIVVTIDGTGAHRRIALAARGDGAAASLARFVAPAEVEAA